MSDDTPPQPGAGSVIARLRNAIVLSNPAFPAHRIVFQEDISRDELTQLVDAADRCHAMEAELNEHRTAKYFSEIESQQGLLAKIADLDEQLAVALAEIADLKEKLLDAQSAATPTQWAYDQACAALEKHRHRADEADAKLAMITYILADRGKAQEGGP